MRNGWFLSLVLFGALCAGSVPPAQAQGRSQTDRAEIERRRQRWQQMSEDERRVLQRRFRELQRLTEDERRELEKRAARLKELEQGLREATPETLQRELDAVDPQRRQALWRSHVFERSRDMGRRTRDRLPLDVRRRLENASPEERRKTMKHIQGEMEARSGQHLERMARELRLSPEETRRLAALAPAERARAMMKLRRRMIERRIEASGLPGALDERRWKELKELSDEAFFQRMRALEGLRDPRSDRRTDRRPADRPPSRRAGSDARRSRSDRERPPSSSDA